MLIGGLNEPIGEYLHEAPMQIVGNVFIQSEIRIYR